MTACAGRVTVRNRNIGEGHAKDGRRAKRAHGRDEAVAALDVHCKQRVKADAWAQ